MPHLQPVDRLVVDVVLDNMSDSYSSKPHHVSPEFNNVMAAGAKELSGSTLCCAQLGLALVLTAHVGDRYCKLLFAMQGPRGRSFSETARTLGCRWRMCRPSPYHTGIGIIWARCWIRSTT